MSRRLLARRSPPRGRRWQAAARRALAAAAPFVVALALRALLILLTGQDPLRGLPPHHRRLAGLAGQDRRHDHGLGAADARRHRARRDVRGRAVEHRRRGPDRPGRHRRRRSWPAQVAAPPIVLVPLTLLAGVVFGVAWALLAGILKTRGRVHEIFGGLGLDFVAAGLTLYLVIGPWARPGIASTSGTEPFPA